MENFWITWLSEKKTQAKVDLIKGAKLKSFGCSFFWAAIKHQLGDINLMTRPGLN